MGAAAACGYHCSAKPVSFGRGQSAVHTAAYNARAQLYQEREGRPTRNYARHDGEVLFSGIFAPKDAPAWVHDRQELWNRAEAAERQKVNGQPARNMIVAFPHQLDQEQREWMLKDFTREQFARRGMVADVSIHAPDQHGDQKNYHAHILLTMRELDGDGFAKTKNRDWNSKATLAAWREDWAEKGARALERAGFEVEGERWRHGHQTLSLQRAAALERGDTDYAARVDREATGHKGPKISGIERRGGDSGDRLAALHEIIERNDIRLEMMRLQDQLVPLEALQASHLKAEEEGRQAVAYKQLEKAARADQASLRAPAPGAASFERSVGDAVRADAAGVRRERLDAKAEADQDAWRARVAEHNPDRIRPGAKALEVVDGATGAVSKLGDFVLDLLSGSSARPAPPRLDMAAFVSDPQARKQHQLGQLAAMREASAADQAMDRIRTDWEAGRRLKAEDIRSLTHDHQTAIHKGGDDMVRQMVEDARKRREHEHDGRERER